MNKEFLMNKIMDYCENVNNKTMISVDDMLTILNENDTIRYALYRETEREYHKEDVMQEIEERNQQYRDDCSEEDKIPDENEMIFATDEEIELITDRYEDNLGECLDWRTCLSNAIEWILD